MSKPRTIIYKGFKIAPSKTEAGRWNIYTRDEWENYGLKFAQVEHDTGSIEEAKEFIDCY